MLRVFKAGIEPQDGGIGAELGKAGKEHGGVDHDTGEAYLFLCQEVGHYEKCGDGAYEDSQIVGQGSFDALFCNDSHTAG